MIDLNTIQIASPCHESWDSMTGDEQIRFCGACKKNVYDISQMTEAQAQQLFEERAGRLCVRLYRRTDGTVLTRDCPVGLRAVRKRFALAASWMIALLAGGTTGLTRPAAGQTTGLVTVPPHTMGKIAAPQPLTGEPTIPNKSHQIMGDVAFPISTPTTSPLMPYARKCRGDFHKLSKADQKHINALTHSQGAKAISDMWKTIAQAK